MVTLRLGNVDSESATNLRSLLGRLRVAKERRSERLTEAKKLPHEVPRSRTA